MKYLESQGTAGSTFLLFEYLLWGSVVVLTTLFRDIMQALFGLKAAQVNYTGTGRTPVPAGIPTRTPHNKMNFQVLIIDCLCCIFFPR